jgi:hypothetical protein
MFDQKSIAPFRSDVPADRNAFFIQRYLKTCALQTVRGAQTRNTAADDANALTH